MDDVSWLLRHIADRIKEIARPQLGVRGGDVECVGQSGDAEFSLDLAVEEVVSQVQSESACKFAYFSEARGLQPVDDAEWLLVIDPIDGTRPARAGFEQCVVSVAALPISARPVLGSVTHASIASVKEDWRLSLSPAGLAVECWAGGKPAKPRGIEHIEEAAWAFEICGRSPAGVFGAIAPLVELSSVTGGVFCYNSSAHALACVATGALDAFVDVGGLLPHRRFGVMPYDLAAAVPIALAAGAVVTDALGRSLGDVPLLESGPDAILSCVAACTPALHARFVKLIAPPQ